LCFSVAGVGSVRCAEEEEPGERVEKLDGTGEGEMPRSAECVLVADDAGEACGMYERRREMVGCKKGEATFDGVDGESAPLGRREDIASGEEREAEVEEGESDWSVEG
jgi:hypothetical protein